jgi:hypothetical protein
MNILDRFGGFDTPGAFLVVPTTPEGGIYGSRPPSIDLNNARTADRSAKNRLEGVNPL